MLNPFLDESVSGTVTVVLRLSSSSPQIGKAGDEDFTGSCLDGRRAMASTVVRAIRVSIVRELLVCNKL